LNFADWREEYLNPTQATANPPRHCDHRQPRKNIAGLYYGWRMIGRVAALRILCGGLHQYGFTVFFYRSPRTWV